METLIGPAIAWNPPAEGRLINKPGKGNPVVPENDSDTHLTNLEL
ncbi:hypothetical protein [Spirosoma foliorum]|nr:hypothetical protein [Spirosoma foliorum]